MAEGRYFDTEPAVASRPAEVELALPDGVLRLRTDRGVFSGSRVDPGTLVLLRESPAPPATGDLLDLGCGYGPIGLTLARRAPGAVVWAVDVNQRALQLVRDNAAGLGLTNVRAVTPDAVPAGVELAGLWSNPPVRVGKQALHDLLLAWLPRLAPGAVAWLVVQRHLGSDSLADWLDTEGYEARRRSSKRGYRVLEVRPVGP
jgi:16S rRNA (guanine1207-N2)-methyltransferase